VVARKKLSWVDHVQNGQELDSNDASLVLTFEHCNGASWGPRTFAIVVKRMEGTAEYGTCMVRGNVW
jgi:hypothetical protein